MRWKPISDRVNDWLDRRNRRREEWHEWFAWYPVKVDGSVYWLEAVIRRREKSGRSLGITVVNVMTGSPVYVWRYKAP